jgi:TonB family protein
MRYLVSICALLLLSTALFAQTSIKVENWQTFSPASDEFSVEAPLTLDQRGDNATGSSRKFSGTINGVYVFVFSDPLKKAAGPEQRYSAMVRDVLTQIGQSSDAIATDDPGMRPTSFKDKFGYFHNLTTLRTETRSYIAQTVTLDEKSEIAARFIKSFTLAPNPQVPRPPVGQAELNKQSSVVEGHGTGSGSGSGASSPVPVLPPSATGSPLSSNLKILSKSRPAYTDMARIYGIQGTVILQVEFRSTGEIGAVKALSQLPFGLTETAIAAAQRVTFEPATVEGAPVSVVKRLEYSYSIY